MITIKSDREIEKIMIVKDRAHTNFKEILSLAKDKGIVKQIFKNLRLTFAEKKKIIHYLEKKL